MQWKSRGKTFDWKKGEGNEVEVAQNVKIVSGTHSNNARSSVDKFGTIILCHFALIKQNVIARKLNVSCRYLCEQGTRARARCDQQQQNRSKIQRIIRFVKNEKETRERKKHAETDRIEMITATAANGNTKSRTDNKKLNRRRWIWRTFIFHTCQFTNHLTTFLNRSMGNMDLFGCFSIFRCCCCCCS